MDVIKDDDETAPVCGREYRLTHTVEDLEPFLRGFDTCREEAVGVGSK